MAGHVSIFGFDGIGPLGPAALKCMGTSRMERAARRGVDGTWNFSGYRGALAAGHGQIRDGIQKHTCIRVPGSVE